MNGWILENIQKDTSYEGGRGPVIRSDPSRHPVLTAVVAGPGEASGVSSASTNYADHVLAVRGSFRANASC